MGELVNVLIGRLDDAPDGEPRYCSIRVPKEHVELVTPELQRRVLRHHRRLDRCGEAVRCRSRSGVRTVSTRRW